MTDRRLVVVAPDLKVGPTYAIRRGRQCAERARLGSTKYSMSRSSSSSSSVGWTGAGGVDPYHQRRLEQMRLIL